MTVHVYKRLLHGSSLVELLVVTIIKAWGLEHPIVVSTVNEAIGWGLTHTVFVIEFDPQGLVAFNVMEKVPVSVNFITTVGDEFRFPEITTQPVGGRIVHDVVKEVTH